MYRTNEGNPKFENLIHNGDIDDEYNVLDEEPNMADIWWKTAKHNKL